MHGELLGTDLQYWILANVHRRRWRDHTGDAELARCNVLSV
jgi:hypothetical protein